MVWVRASFEKELGLVDQAVAHAQLEGRHVLISRRFLMEVESRNSEEVLQDVASRVTEAVVATEAESMNEW